MTRSLVLFDTTQIIVNYLKQQHGPVKVSDLAKMTCKRRCYDVLIVLKAIGKVRHIKKNMIEWVRDEISDNFDDEIISEKIWDLS